jgi:transposase
MLLIAHQKRLTSFWLGRKCVFCTYRKTYVTARGYVKCGRCGRQKSLKRLRRELEIISAFVEQRPALQVSIELGVSYQVVSRIFRQIRELIFLQCEMEGKRLSGEVEMDESYFGGRRKGKRGRGAAGKSVVFGILERQGRVYTKVVYNLTAENLLSIIKKKTRKGSVFYTDTFTSYNSLKQYGKHRTVNHKKVLVETTTRNHINGIEGFWSYTKHKLYNYHGVSKANFGLYLKEMEFRFNHRKDNIFEPIMKLYFGYVSY